MHLAFAGGFPGGGPSQALGRPVSPAGRQPPALGVGGPVSANGIASPSFASD